MRGHQPICNASLVSHRGVLISTIVSANGALPQASVYWMTRIAPSYIMGSLVFRLQYVTVEEAGEVRDLLAANGIAFYETDSGFFGTQVAGIWVKNKDDKERAKQLLNEYSQARALRIQQEYQDRKAADDIETLWQRYKTHPFKLTFAFGVIAIILYLSIVPLYYYLQ